MPEESSQNQMTEKEWDKKLAPQWAGEGPWPILSSLTGPCGPPSFPSFPFQLVIRGKQCGRGGYNVIIRENRKGQISSGAALEFYY